MFHPRHQVVAKRMGNGVFITAQDTDDVRAVGEETSDDNIIDPSEPMPMWFYIHCEEDPTTDVALDHYTLHDDGYTDVSTEGYLDTISGEYNGALPAWRLCVVDVLDGDCLQVYDSEETGFTVPLHCISRATATPCTSIHSAQQKKVTLHGTMPVRMLQLKLTRYEYRFSRC